MGFRKISNDMKERALHLLTEGWELPAIADVLVVPPSYHQGRRRLLSAEAISDLKELVDESPELYLDEIGEWLALYHDIPMSTTALHDNLHDLGLTRKLMRRQAAERDHALRTAWLHDVLSTYTAEQMVVVDETSKDGKTLIRKYGRAMRGHDPVYTVSLNRGIRYSAVPALTVKGYIAARAVEGSIDGGEFYDFIANDVLPCMNPWPGPRSVLVLDNCATHKSEALRELFEGTGIRLLFLPPYSPDFSPIEESFSCVKAYLRRNFRQFQDTLYPEQDLVDACFAAVTPEKAEGWFRDCGYL